MAEEWVTLQDGRQLCLECLDTLVVDTKDAQPLYEEVGGALSCRGTVLLETLDDLTQLGHG